MDTIGDVEERAQIQIFTHFNQENKLRTQKNCAPVTGNTSGRRFKRQREWITDDKEHMPKRVSGRGSY